jgi:hypothetical protein
VPTFCDGFLKGVGIGEVEDEDGDVVVEAERECGRIHDVETLAERVDKGEGVVFDGVGVLLGVFVVNAVHLSGFHDDVGAHLRGAQGGGGIGGEVRVTGAGDEDDDAAFFKVAHGAAEDEGLGDLVHRDGALDAGGYPEFFEGVHDGEAVDDGGEHAHVVAGGAIDAALLALEAAEDIAAADDNANLDAEIVDIFNLTAHALKYGGVDGVGPFAAEHFAAQLQDDTFIANARRLLAGGFAHRA